MLSAARGLSAVELDAVADLEGRVVAADGGRLKLDWASLWSRSGERVEDLLWWEGDELAGSLGMYSFGPTPELAGMVDPRHRRQGIGSALLAAARHELAGRGVTSALVVCPRTGAGGAQFLARRGGVPDHSEHALVLRGAPSAAEPTPGVTLRAATGNDRDAVTALVRSGFGDADYAWTVEPEEDLVAELDGEVVAYLRARLDDAAAFGEVHGFVVRTDLRGRGYGRDVLRRVCVQLHERGASSIGLEVAATNERALGLYRSLGFDPVITEDYLRLTVGE